MRRTERPERHPHEQRVVVCLPDNGRVPLFECTCRSPLPSRKYGDMWMCALCGLPIEDNSE